MSGKGFPLATAVDVDSPMRIGPYPLESRIRSFQDWRYPGVVLPRALAEDGFYHAGHHKLVCHGCKFTTLYVEPNKDPRVEHWLCSPSCHLSNRAEKCRFFGSESNRLLTYPDDWESICLLTKSELAKAGYCFTGGNRSSMIDLVWCYSCDIQLKQWEPDDKPLEQHQDGCGLARLLAYEGEEHRDTSGYVSFEVDRAKDDIRAEVNDVPTMPPE